jgi:hypothetical protein
MFKELLLEYIDLITADVSRHAPAIALRCDRILPQLDRILAALDSLPALVMPDGTPADRMPGRSRADWEQFDAWYRQGWAFRPRNATCYGRPGASAAANECQAHAGTGICRGADLLKLAAWFDQTGTEDAHRLYAATFGVFPARHLFGGPDEANPKDGVNTSWWDATPIDVPVSLRDRGDRQSRGRSAAVPDPGLDGERLLREVEAEARARRVAADEIHRVTRPDGYLLHINEKGAFKNDVRIRFAEECDRCGFVDRYHGLRDRTQLATYVQQTGVRRVDIDVAGLNWDKQITYGEALEHLRLKLHSEFWSVPEADYQSILATVEQWVDAQPQGKQTTEEMHPFLTAEVFQWTT